MVHCLNSLRTLLEFILRTKTKIRVKMQKKCNLLLTVALLECNCGRLRPLKSLAANIYVKNTRCLLFYVYENIVILMFISSF